MFNKDDLLAFDRSVHSAHRIVLDIVKARSDVLDIGCNAGYVGKKLIEEKNCSVSGVDINRELLKKAKEHGYQQTSCIDLANQAPPLGRKRYDFILFLDILEHLPRPDLVLVDSRKYLKPSGKVIISLPNIARFEIRLKLLFGEFDYAPGILGEDHLRFFTRKSATELIENCSYKVEYTIPTGLGHRIKIFPTLIAFQFIYVCSSA